MLVLYTIRYYRFNRNGQEYLYENTPSYDKKRRKSAREANIWARTLNQSSKKFRHIKILFAINDRNL